MSDKETKDAIFALNNAFDTFKAEHKQQLEDAKKGINDALQVIKVDKINADISELQKAVDDLNIRHVAAQMNGAGTGVKDAEYTDAFKAHMKRGDISASMNKGTAAEGGYLAPVEWDRTITDRLTQVSPIRRLAQVQTISGAGFSKLFNMGGTTSGWVGEADARPNTNTATFSKLDYTPCEIYANPAATQQILDDAEINLEAWLAAGVQLEFAKQEGMAFLNGTAATKKPDGLLTYITGNANAAKHPFGAIEVVNSGDAAFVTSDSIIDIIYKLPSEFTGNATFIMNRNTLGTIRKLKDGQGNYLWQPSFIAGEPSTLAGYPTVEVPGMPDIAANSTPIMFGDFRQGYLIIDRIGIRVLRDPYTNKPFVSFYTTKRVGGGLLNPEPLRALKVAA